MCGKGRMVVATRLASQRVTKRERVNKERDKHNNNNNTHIQQHNTNDSKH